MEWTIEKVRELPEDNWLGIKRVGDHIWEIGGDIPGGMVMCTGDGGVLEYCNSFQKNMEEAAKQYKGVLDQINDQVEYTRLNPLTYEYLEALIREELLSNCKKDGMA